MKNYEFKALGFVNVHPLVYKMWTFSFVLLIFLFIILFLPWRQTVTGEGELIALDPSERVQHISSPIDGFIERYHVKEDEYVKAGVKLFDMTDLDKAYKTRVQNIKKDYEEQYGNTKNEWDILQQKKESLIEQKKIEIDLYDKRYTQSLEQLKSLELKYEARKKSYEVNLIQYKRMKTLYSQKIESKRNYESAEKSYIASKAEMEKTEIEIDVQKRNLLIVQQEKKRFLEQMKSQIYTVENAILSAQTKLNALKREYERHLTEIARYATSSVISEKNGHVLRILKNDKNTYIRKGEQVLLFSPDITSRSILMRVSDFNMPLIKESLRVRIRFHGWPVLHIPGWPAIKFGTFGGIIKKVDPILHEPGFYYAYVVEDPNEPWPSGKELKAGTKSTLWVALSNVPIWYELWRLMNAFPPKMVTPEKR